MELKCIQIQTEIGLLFFPFRNPGYSHICKAHQLNVLVEYMYVLAGNWEVGGREVYWVVNGSTINKYSTGSKAISLFN